VEGEQVERIRVRLTVDERADDEVVAA